MFQPFNDKTLVAQFYEKEHRAHAQLWVDGAEGRDFRRLGIHANHAHPKLKRRRFHSSWHGPKQRFTREESSILLEKHLPRLAEQIREWCEQNL